MGWDDINQKLGVENIINNFDFRDAYIQSLHYMTGMSYVNDEEESRAVMYIEGSNGKNLQLFFGDILICHLPSMKHKNEKMNGVTLEYKNGNYYFSNVSGFKGNEKDYSEYNNIYIKCKYMQYKFL